MPNRRGYQDYEKPEQRDDMKGWINFKRPIDLNTVVILFGIIVGGLSFRSDTISSIAALKAQVEETRAMTVQRIDKLSDRLDTVIDEAHRDKFRP